MLIVWLPLPTLGCPRASRPNTGGEPGGSCLRCHDDANSTWAGDTGARRGRSGQGAWRHSGLVAHPHLRGQAGVLTCARGAMLGQSVCPSVLLERPHCCHTSVPTPGPEPCGQGLPLIHGDLEHPRPLPQAECGFHLPAGCCNHQITWGWRQACTTCVCVQMAWAMSPKAHRDTLQGQGQMTGTPPRAHAPPWSKGRRQHGPPTANYYN